MFLVLPLRAIESLEFFDNLFLPLLVETLGFKADLKFEVALAQRPAIGVLMAFVAVIGLDVTASRIATITAKCAMQGGIAKCVKCFLKGTTVVFYEKIVVSA